MKCPIHGFFLLAYIFGDWVRICLVKMSKQVQIMPVNMLIFIYIFILIFFLSLFRGITNLGITNMPIICLFFSKSEPEYAYKR